MNFYEDFRDNHSNQKNMRSPWAFFLVGFAGVIMGAILLLLIFIGGGWLFNGFSPFSPPRNEEETNQDQNLESQEEERLPLPPREHQNTEVVNAVERVASAVVGVSNYRDTPSPQGYSRREQGTGSGVVVEPGGIIITNHHVITGADTVKVIFQDHEVIEAEVIGKDPETDLAVLEIETDRNLDYAKFTDEERLFPGETAIAIGNPLGLAFQQTVTVGVVSATERQVRIPGSEYNYTFLQTDAAINEGNSGGPLVNIRGEIIGINSAKVLDPRVEGIGFAIPGTTVERVTRDIMDHGYVVRPHLGVLIMDYSEVTGIATESGVYVEEVEPGSPADEAGIRSGDVIVKLSGKEINYYAQLFDALLNYYPGDNVDISVMRDDAKETFHVTLGEAPEGW